MNKNSIEVVGLGALNMDHIYQVERILDDGETVVKESVSFPGGSAANTIYGLARLGVKTGFAGVVGDDEEGKILIQDFRRAGVDASQVRVKAGAKTGSVFCLSDSSGKRALYVSPGVNSLLGINDLDLSYINRAKMLHVSSFADDRQLEVTLELLNQPDLPVNVSFSPGAIYAVKGLGALVPILARAYVLFINQNEMRQLTGQDVVAGAETCVQQGCRIVVVTLGGGTNIRTSRGSQGGMANTVGYIRDAAHEYLIQAPQKRLAPPLDTTGAGDAFAAGFLYGLLKSKDLEECGRLGDTVAQFSVSKIGARQGLPTLNELSQRYRELYNREL